MTAYVVQKATSAHLRDKWEVHKMEDHGKCFIGRFPFRKQAITAARIFAGWRGVVTVVNARPVPEPVTEWRLDA